MSADGRARVRVPLHVNDCCCFFSPRPSLTASARALGNSHKEANASPFSSFEIDDECLTLVLWMIFFLFCFRCCSTYVSRIILIRVHICHTSIGSGRSAIYSYLRVREPFYTYTYTLSGFPFVSVSVCLSLSLAPAQRQTLGEQEKASTIYESTQRIARVKMNGKLFSENVSNNYCRLFRTNTV